MLCQGSRADIGKAKATNDTPLVAPAPIKPKPHPHSLTLPGMYVPVVTFHHTGTKPWKTTGPSGACSSASHSARPAALKRASPAIVQQQQFARAFLFKTHQHHLQSVCPHPPRPLNACTNAPVTAARRSNSSEGEAASPTLVLSAAEP